MNQTSVLFLCIHNSARSQIAEAYLNKYGNGKFQVESAGLETGLLNPLAVEVMAEEGIDISTNLTKEVDEFYRAGRSFQYVITVCDPKASDQCPLFPGMHRKINWAFDDPSVFAGSDEEKLQKIRVVRNLIKKAVLNFIDKFPDV